MRLVVHSCLASSAESAATPMKSLSMDTAVNTTRRLTAAVWSIPTGICYAPKEPECVKIELQERWYFGLSAWRMVNEQGSGRRGRRNAESYSRPSCLGRPGPGL